MAMASGALGAARKAGNVVGGVGRAAGKAAGRVAGKMGRVAGEAAQRAVKSVRSDGRRVGHDGAKQGVPQSVSAAEGVQRGPLEDALLKRVTVTQRGGVHLVAEVRQAGCMVVDVVFASRVEALDARYSLPFSVKPARTGLLVDIRFDPKNYELLGAYWDIRLALDPGTGEPSLVGVQMNAAFRSASRVLNMQYDYADGNILFPYPSGANRIAFAYRKRTKTDTAFTRAKEFAAFAVFAAGHKYWTRKRVWLVFEKYCSFAQDNGYYFFKYCMDEVDRETGGHVYFVIDKSAPDYANVAAYDDHVIDFMSFKHMLYAMVADIYVGSDSKTHLYQYRPKASVVLDRLRKHKILFLQHGVTALKRVDDLFGRAGSNPMTYFLTTSEKEQSIVVENFGYEVQAAPVLGFSRWDVLRDTSDAAHPMVLIMPTWRPWLEEQTDAFFTDSQYFAALASLAKSPALQEVLAYHGAHAKFYIHPKLSAYLKNFEDAGERVEFVDAGSVQLNELIMECSMLVTDYSSVSWDVLFMDKPVVYYQFDQDAYKKYVGSYIDLDTELPGPVCRTEQSCVDAVARYAASNFAPTETDAARSRTYLPVKDRENRARTFRFLLDEGF